MKTSSRKAKGRRLQNWTRDELLSRFSNLSDDDIYCAIMGESGADVHPTHNNIYNTQLSVKIKRHLKVYMI